METQALMFSFKTPYNGGDTMTYYKIKVISISGERTIKVPEKEMNWFLVNAAKRGWHLEFIG